MMHINETYSTPPFFCIPDTVIWILCQGSCMHIKPESCRSFLAANLCKIYAESEVCLKFPGKWT